MIVKATINRIKKTNQTAGFSVCLLFVLFLTSTFVSGQGNLMIMPRRVVFEGAKNSIDLTLVNTGTDTAKYVVSMVQMRMKEDGSFEQIATPDSGQFFADKYLRFFPRTVNLAPNETQMVKMQVARAENLEPGEYRSHVYFRSVPKAKPLGEMDIIKDTVSGVSIHLQPIFGITIPVILRIGENKTTVNLADLALEKVNDSTNRLNMVFNRSGNMSVYGDVFVDYVSPTGTVTRVSTVKGIAVYTPILRRKFSVNLEKMKGVDYHSGKLIVNYSSPADIKAMKLAEATLLLT